MVVTQQQPSANSGNIIALIVALGGFLMGFDASVISGAVGSIEQTFSLNKLQLGWTVASLTLSAAIAMLLAGPVSQKLGRIKVLKAAAILFALSAIASAVADSYTTLVIARMVGGFGVGAALIVAPMYIAEIAPPEQRGKMVSFNQLNIVIGISAAFFSNYLIVRLGQSDLGIAQSLGMQEHGWRWMLGIETLPALLYWWGLTRVPESPRWLLMQNHEEEAQAVMQRFVSQEQATEQLRAAKAELQSGLAEPSALQLVSELMGAPIRIALIIGLCVAIVQQLTGINAVFFYAPMIFEQSGFGTNAAFMQAVLVGLVNLVFTLLAMRWIDHFGRRPLLLGGLAGITIFMLLLAYSFDSASYMLTPEHLTQLPDTLNPQLLQNMVGVEYASDLAFKDALATQLGEASFASHEALLTKLAVDLNATLVLTGILGFVACFAISVGPVMWVLFSELFPNRLRALAVSILGLVNSGVSFAVQLYFPWALLNWGAADTFLFYGIAAAVGLVILAKLLPETKGQSLESLQALFAKSA